MCYIPGFNNDYSSSMLYLWKDCGQQVGSVPWPSSSRVYRRVSYLLRSCPLIDGKFSWELSNSLYSPFLWSDALDALGLKRYCCRRMLLAHVDLIEKLLNYAPLEKWCYHFHHKRKTINGLTQVVTPLPACRLLLYNSDDGENTCDQSGSLDIANVKYQTVDFS